MRSDILPYEASPELTAACDSILDLFRKHTDITLITGNTKIALSAPTIELMTHILRAMRDGDGLKLTPDNLPNGQVAYQITYLITAIQNGADTVIREDAEGQMQIIMRDIHTHDSEK